MPVAGGSGLGRSATTIEGLADAGGLCERVSGNLAPCGARSGPVQPEAIDLKEAGCGEQCRALVALLERVSAGYADQERRSKCAMILLAIVPAVHRPRHGASQPSTIAHKGKAPALFEGEPVHLDRVIGR